MDRLTLLFACVALVGCQAPRPNFNPFAITGQTRVPPPPTGAVGNQGSYDQQVPSLAPAPGLAPPPSPPLNRGSGTRGDDGFSSSGTWHPNSPGRDPEARRSNSNGVSDSVRLANAQSAEVIVQRNDRLTWLDPHDRSPTTPSLIVESPSVVSYPSSAADNVVVRPRPLPGTGPVQPLAGQSASVPSVSPPLRIRGFVNSGVRPVQIPAQLAQLQGEDRAPLRTASNRWQARFKPDTSR